MLSVFTFTLNIFVKYQILSVCPFAQFSVKIMENLGLRLAQDDQFVYNTLIHIFKYLPVSDLINCARVCSTWKWVVAADTIWNDLHVYVCENHYKDILNYHGGNLKNLMLDIHSLNDFEEVCQLDVKKVEKIALTYSYYDSLHILSKYNNTIKQMHIQFMDRFQTEPKVFDHLKNFCHLTHLEIVEFSPYHLLKDAKFLYFMPKLEHLSLWSRCEEEVWFDVVEQTQLQSLHLYSGDENCMDVMFKYGEIEKLTNLKKLKISNVCFEVVIRKNKKPSKDRYLFTLWKTEPDYFAEDNILMLSTLVDLKDQLEVLEWISAESIDGVSFPIIDLNELFLTMSTVHHVVCLPLENNDENVLVPFSELENIIKLWMPDTKVSVMYSETMARKTKLPQCVMCGKKKFVQYSYFFGSFFNSFTS